MSPGIDTVAILCGGRGTRLQELAVDAQLRAFRHTGFWDCMHTYRDAVPLNDLWSRGNPPWKLWH